MENLASKCSPRAPGTETGGPGQVIYQRKDHPSVPFAAAFFKVLVVDHRL